MHKVGAFVVSTTDNMLTLMIVMFLECARMRTVATCRHNYYINLENANKTV